MSKRFVFQEYGERKKAKLDVSMSDHNFPLSQNATSKKDGEKTDNWGDDNDDEFLLLASQVVEEVIKDSDTSIIPNYSMCMQPTSTSTQLSEHNASSSFTSRNSFKKPLPSIPGISSTKLKDKCEKISSPLPGLSEVYKHIDINTSDDIITNDQNKDTNSNNLYRQLLKLQEENLKLKTENGNLLEKYVTKEGEASILRTQLKSCQASVDNVRLEKMKAQEKAQMEWSDKMAAANNKLFDLRTQLDSKNLDIISMKEKCKVLESNKVNLTQVMVTTNDISMSQRHNNSIHINSDSKTSLKKLRCISNGVQTDDKSHFLKLNIPQTEELSKLSQFLPIIMEPTDKCYCILDYNEKLKLHTNTQNKFRIFSTFHWFPPTSCVSKGRQKNGVNLQCTYEDISYIATSDGNCLDRYLNIIKTVKDLLGDVQTELDMVRQRVTTAFQKEMDEKYIESTTKLMLIDRKDLLHGSALYKEEQALLARRMTAVLTYVIKYSKDKNVIDHLLQQEMKRQTHSIISYIERICDLLDSSTCAILYSGLLLSFTYLIQTIHKHIDKKTIFIIVKTIIFSRPMPFVSSHILGLLSSIYCDEFARLCTNNVNGDLKVDYDQGVLLFKKDSCPLQILINEIEALLKCLEKEKSLKAILENTTNVLLLHSRLKLASSNVNEEQRCRCEVATAAAVVYGLRLCAAFVHTGTALPEKLQRETRALCVSALAPLQSIALLPLAAAEGHLLHLADTLRAVLAADVADSAAQVADSAAQVAAVADSAADVAGGGRALADLLAESHCNILSEISSTLQLVEEESASYCSEAWLGALHTLSLAD